MTTRELKRRGGQVGGRLNRRLRPFGDSHAILRPRATDRSGPHVAVVVSNPLSMGGCTRSTTLKDSPWGWGQDQKAPASVGEREGTKEGTCDLRRRGGGVVSVGSVGVVGDDSSRLASFLLIYSWN